MIILVQRKKLNIFLRYSYLSFHGCFLVLAFPAEAARPSPERSLLKHVLTGRVHRPIVTFSRPTQSLRQFDKTLIQRQIMAHRILPALVRSAEEGEILLEKLVNFVEGHFPGRCVLNGHDDERDVGEGRLLVPAVVGSFGGRFSVELSLVIRTEKKFFLNLGKNFDQQNSTENVVEKRAEISFLRPLYNYCKTSLNVRWYTELTGSRTRRYLLFAFVF